jgi:hypothetical protein
LLGLLETGMDLDLVDDRLHPGLVDDAVEMLALEVRDSDGADAAIFLELHQYLPGIDEETFPGSGPVDEIQVEIVKPELRHALIEGCKRAVVALRVIP